MVEFWSERDMFLFWSSLNSWVEHCLTKDKSRGRGEMTNICPSFNVFSVTYEDSSGVSVRPGFGIILPSPEIVSAAVFMLPCLVSLGPVMYSHVHFMKPMSGYWGCNFIFFKCSFQLYYKAILYRPPHRPPWLFKLVLILPTCQDTILRYREGERIQMWKTQAGMGLLPVLTSDAQVCGWAEVLPPSSRGCRAPANLSDGLAKETFQVHLTRQQRAACSAAAPLAGPCSSYMAPLTSHLKGRPSAAIPAGLLFTQMFLWPFYRIMV